MTPFGTAAVVVKYTAVGGWFASILRNKIKIFATSFYDTTACQQYCLSPQPTYAFAKYVLFP